MKHNNHKPKVLVLSAKTGGGHRAAALAVIEELEHYNDIEIIHHDFMENAPKPISNMPKLYSQITKVKPAYGTIFKLTEGSKQSALTIKTGARLYKKTIRDVLQAYQPDLILSFHFAANVFLQEAQTFDQHIPFITVVTDLATGHPLWFDKRNDLIIVPSTESFERARSFGVRSTHLKIAGLPVSSQFAVSPKDKTALKRSFGWPTDKPTLLVMAGGDGMGKISTLTKRLDKMPTDAHLGVIAGRNQALYNQLCSRHYNKSHDIYQFRDDVAELMHASDLLLTKAGPQTIVEGMVSQVPIVLYDFLPGQEEGNLHYVAENSAGVWASTNSLAITATEGILSGKMLIGGAKYEKARQRHIEAAHTIAATTRKYLGI